MRRTRKEKATDVLPVRVFLDVGLCYQATHAVGNDVYIGITEDWPDIGVNEYLKIVCQLPNGFPPVIRTKEKAGIRLVRNR